MASFYRLAAAAAALAALVALAGAHAAGVSQVDAFSFDLVLTVPRLVLVGCFAVAAGFAGVLALADCSRKAPWVVDSALLAAVAAETALAAQQRMHRQDMGLWQLELLALTLPVALWLWTATARWTQPAGRAVFGAGAILWCTGRALGTAGPDPGSFEGVVAGAVELTGGVALVLGLAAAVGALLGPGRTLMSEAHGLVVRLDPREVAVALGVTIAALGAIGLAVAAGRLDMFTFDLNDERNVPAAFSGALLTAAAALALLAARAGVAGARRPWLALAGVFAFLAVDEVGGLHETLQAASGTFGQAFFLPVFALLGIAWLVTVLPLKRLSPAAAGLYLTAPFAWAASQGADALHAPHAGRNGFAMLVVPEELLEMTGSALFVLALLIALRRGAEAYESRAATAPATSVVVASPPRS